LDFSLILREPKRDFKRGFVVMLLKISCLFSLKFIVSKIILRELFKEIKISIFDRALALTLGLLPEVFHYLLMSLVSVTAVVSFDVVGATLMISFMIGPATTAYMISKNLKMMLIYSALIGAISSILGYHLAVFLDVSISGSIAVVIGIIFFVVLFGKKFKKYAKIKEA